MTDTAVTATTEATTTVLGATAPVTDAAKAAVTADANKGVDATGDKNPDGTPKEGETKDTKAEYVYQDVKVPEGVELDATSLTEFNTLAKEVKVTTEQAQKLVDWYGKHAQAHALAQQKTWEDTNKGWVDQAKSDPEIGGDKFDTTVTSAKAAIKKFGSEKFIEALNVTGAGNHPEVIRFLHKVAEAFKEDGVVLGVTNGEKAKSAAEILFGNSK